MVDIERPDGLRYQPYYCEENIWQLVGHPTYADGFVLFIASRGKYFPMLRQRAAAAPDQAICWDYHVVLLQPENPAHIIDFDSTLGFSTELTQYLRESFYDNALLEPDAVPLFRLVPARSYRQLLHSDCSHMRTASGEWTAPPPQWPCIGEGGSNLWQFTDMTNTQLGAVLTAADLLARFGSWA